MRKISYPLVEKASISLNAAAHRDAAPAAAALRGFRETSPAILALDGGAVRRMPVLIELAGSNAEPPADGLEPLADGFFSARLTPEEALALAAAPGVRRVQTKRRKTPRLRHVAKDIRLVRTVDGPRLVEETGRGVFLGIIDSGFDLSHPAFRDSAGRLRVDALLVQDDTGTTTEFTIDELEEAWRNGADPSLPGFDEDGHGTHVASIAAGIAPDARLLLVKTNFTDTDNAASWIFGKARATPCAINMSIGHHWGGHDGTDAEEQLQQTLTATPGRAIVVSAGNERTDPIHLGGRFRPDQVQEVTFDLLEREEEFPSALLTLWYAAGDRFDIDLVRPGGDTHRVPGTGSADVVASSLVRIDLARKRSSPSAVHAQIEITFQQRARRASLRGWRLRLACRRAAVGRLDAWFSDAGFAAFRAHPLLEESRTICLPGTGDGCIAVASHVVRNRWRSDVGPQHAPDAVVGRSSPFSSLGPVRAGSSMKPDISAPGQSVTAALAALSVEAENDERTEVGERLLTLEGTSMAAPVVAGAIALMLQKRPGATLAAIRDALRRSARRDAHTGPAEWDPVYGYGKIDLQRALALI